MLEPLVIQGRRVNPALTVQMVNLARQEIQELMEQLAALVPLDQPVTEDLKGSSG